MADYFAVLSRTLSGFGDAKPALRVKLYERARQTIQRQLENRTPPPDEATVEAEMAKLEKAIEDIEAGYLAKEAGDGEPAAESAPDSENRDSAYDISEAKESPDVEPSDGPTIDAPPEPTDETATTPVFDAGDETDTEAEATSGGEGDTSDAVDPVELPVFLPQKSPVYKPDADPSDYGEQSITDEQLEEVERISDPVEDWAHDFKTSRGSTAEALAAGSVDGSTNETQAEAATSDASGDPDPATPTKPEELPAFNKDSVDETLAIPPAPSDGSAGAERSGGGFLKWLLLLLVILFLLAIAAGAARYFTGFGQPYFERLGIDGYFEQSVTPRPVKTITIKPDPVEDEPQQPQSETPQPEPEEPKSEDRLTGDGGETQPEAPAAVPQESETQTPETQPEGETPEAAASEAATGVPAAEAGAAPVVAQKAILYEEGGTSAENTFDAGRVLWSQVEETASDGETKEAAIRARVEIPSRNVVMIMTIKRNSDKALPASHLIELVFAVPDDFKGGSIAEIDRFVLKDSEQGRGDALIGVPARIADGIFLIALNNLESAQTTNTQFLKNRGWIDIPIQYRTGRRALITMEKGIPGEKVFTDVFAAWEAQ